METKKNSTKLQSDLCFKSLCSTLPTCSHSKLADESNQSIRHTHNKHCVQLYVKTGQERLQNYLYQKKIDFNYYDHNIVIATVLLANTTAQFQPSPKFQPLQQVFYLRTADRRATGLCGSARWPLSGDLDLVHAALIGDMPRPMGSCSTRSSTTCCACWSSSIASM